jgi:hypothetical protein
MARNHHLTIPVYSASGSNAIIRRVSFRQAKEMLEKREAVGFKSPRKNGKGGDISALQLHSLQRDDRPSPTSITAGEMRANIGEYGEAHFVDEARAKIEVWPYIGDDRAPRVGIRV